MADQAPWSVRIAAHVVGAVDRIVGTAMGALQALGEHRSGDQDKPPLAAFRKATAVGAKGAKWTVASVIGLGIILMIAAAVFMHHAKPSEPVIAAVSAASGNRGVIARRCRIGAYRAFPEIEQAECAGRPPVSPAPIGDVK